MAAIYPQDIALVYAGDAHCGSVLSKQWIEH